MDERANKEILWFLSGIIHLQTVQLCQIYILVIFSCARASITINAHEIKVYEGVDLYRVVYPG